MRYKDSALMERIKTYAEDFYIANGRSPSTQEIGNEVGIAKGTAHRYLREMQERGLIKYDGKAITTAKTERVIHKSTPASVFRGGIPCGTPQLIESAVDEVINLPSEIFGTGELYIVSAQGDSMIGAGINDGDLVVINPNAEPRVGDIVVALDGDRQNTLKTLAKDAATGTYYLHPENPKYSDIFVSEITVQGVAQHIIKRI